MPGKTPQPEMDPSHAPPTPAPIGIPATSNFRTRVPGRARDGIDDYPISGSTPFVGLRPTVRPPRGGAEATVENVFVMRVLEDALGFAAIGQQSPHLESTTGSVWDYGDFLDSRTEGKSRPSSESQKSGFQTA